MALPIDQHTSDARAAVNGCKRDKAPFPWTLHRLLDESEDNHTTHIVSWLPSGKAFKVHHRDAFMSDILPSYFRQTRYKSFVRQLNLWGFACVSKGADRGSYTHGSFVRGQPSLCGEMRRTKIKGSSVVAASTCATSSPTPTHVMSTPSCYDQHTSAIDVSFQFPMFSRPCDAAAAADMDSPPSLPAQDALQHHYQHAQHLVFPDSSDAKIADETSQFDDWLESTFGSSSKDAAATKRSDPRIESERIPSDPFASADLSTEPFSQQTGSYHIDYGDMADLDFDLGFNFVCA